MSDEEFGTINVQRGERAREIEVLRQHYRQHREALARMTADAPTEHLASEYQRLTIEIDRAMGKLNELEGSAAVPPPPTPSPAASPRFKTEPGMRPLAASTIADEPREPAELPFGEEEPRSRLPLIVVAAVVALALIAWLIWHASSDNSKTPAIVETGTSTTDSTAPLSTAPDTSIEVSSAPIAAAAASPLVPTPRVQDYGVIRKGTRAVRQFQIANNSSDPISIEVARSACRCLYYEYQSLIPPKAKETLTVTVDGAKAKAGELREVVKIAQKKHPDVATSVDVNATVQ